MCWAPALITTRSNSNTRGANLFSYPSGTKEADYTLFVLLNISLFILICSYTNKSSTRGMNLFSYPSGAKEADYTFYVLLNISLFILIVIHTN